MKKRVQQKVETWRQQPEHHKLQKASRLTLLGFGSIVALWLFVLLPVQLKLNVDSKESVAQAIPTPQANQQVAAVSPSPGVAGTRDEVRFKYQLQQNRSNINSTNTKEVTHVSTHPVFENGTF